MSDFIIIFTVRGSTGYSIDSFNTQQFGSQEAALVEARKSRDAYNASEFGKENPAKIVRSWRRNTSKPL